MKESILLGYEVPTGEPVTLLPHHLAIFGITQLSGKTTTLEALITRAGLRAIAFIVKRGEAGFTGEHRIPAFYKPRSDWQYVEGLVNVALGEKVKYEPGMRYGIMQACKDRKDLKEIQQSARAMAKDCKREFMRSVYEKLVAYLEIVIPELERHVFVDTLELGEGVNVMDLSDMRLETQHLVIASTIEHALAHLDHVVVVIPEAWETIPQGKMTPVKWVAQQYIRKGAALGNYLWLDSIPGYEVLFVRRNGLVETTTLEQLFAEADGAIEATQHGEEIRAFESDVEVLAPGSNRLIWRTIEKIIRHGYSGEILRINTKSGLIDVSYNHPVMKYPKYLVEAGALKTNDRLCMRVFGEGRYHSNDVQLFIGTEDLAWFYGFFVAEGGVTGKDRKHVTLYNKDKSLLARAQRIIKDNFHLSASFTSPRRGVYGLDVASPRLVEHLRSCYLKGAKLNTYNKMVPIAILNAPLSIKRPFFNGYVAGDGHIDRKRGLRCLTSASRVLMLGLTWLLHSVMEKSTFTLHIRDDKPKIVQLSINKGKHTRYGGEVKKIKRLQHSGYLYDLEVGSHDHTFYLGLGNVRVHNSQDIGGIDKTPLRQCDNWLMGRMKEAHEIERILKQLLGMKVPAEEIQTLPLGHFYAAIGNDVKKVYVLPAGVPAEVGIRVAKGEMSPETVREQFLNRKVEGVNDEVYKERCEQLERKIAELETCLEKERENQLEQRRVFDDMVGKLSDEKAAEQMVKEAEEAADAAEDHAMELEKKLEPFEMLAEALRKVINASVMTEPAVPATGETAVAVQPTLTEFIVKTARREVLEATDESVQGQILMLASKGWFDERRKIKHVRDELYRVYNSSPRPGTVETVLGDLTAKGVLRRDRAENSWVYWLAPEAKALIKVEG